MKITEQEKQMLVLEVAKLFYEKDIRKFDASAMYVANKFTFAYLNSKLMVEKSIDNFPNFNNDFLSEEPSINENNSKLG